MNYRLKFLPTALKEWRKLDNSIQVQFKKKLAERLQQPHVISAKLSGFKNYYKIKLHARGYCLIYEVVDKDLIVFVIAVGKREKNFVYKKIQH